MGKGDKRRPRQVSAETYEDNWHRIFGETKESGRSIETSKDCCENITKIRVPN